MFPTLSCSRPEVMEYERITNGFILFIRPKAKTPVP